jgi:hypothetical protein
MLFSRSECPLSEKVDNSIANTDTSNFIPLFFMQFGLWHLNCDPYQEYVTFSSPYQTGPI